MRHLFFFSFVIAWLGLSAFNAFAQPMWIQTKGPGETRNLEINFDSSGGVYVITGWYGHSDRIFRTTNNGQTWSKLPPPKGLFFNLHTLPNGNLIMQIGAAIQTSTDEGQTWAPIFNVPAPWDSSKDMYGDISSGGTNTLHAETASGTIFVWFGTHTFRSFNEGLSWDTLPGPPYYASSLRAFSSPTLFLLGTNNALYRSTDSGLSWGQVINGVGYDVSWLCSGPTGPMYCDAGGICISTDDGRTWRYKFPDNGFDGIAATGDGDLAVTGDFDIIVFDSSGKLLNDFNSDDNAAFDGPLSVSPDGKFWTNGPVWAGPDSSQLEKYASLPAGLVTSLLYLGGDSILANHYLTTDQGRNWINNPGYTLWYKIIAGSYCDITTFPFLVAPNGYQFFGNSTGIYRSTDGGSTWDNLNFGLSSLSVVCISADSAGNLFTVTTDGIYRSSDNALHWNKLSFPSSATSKITKVAINWSGDVIASAGTSGIYWSQDTGTTWNPIGTGLSGTVNCMLSTPDGHVFAGTDSGVYYLPQGGSSWENASEGLTNLDVLCIIRDTAGTVYVGTNGDGMFRSTQTYDIAASSYVQVASSIPNNLSFTSINPNPCTSSSTITFSCPESAVATVTIFNLLGSEVVRLFDGELSSGEHSFTWDASDAPPGMYECIVQSGGQIQRAPIVVVR